MQEPDEGHLEEQGDNWHIGPLIDPVNSSVPQSQPQGDGSSYSALDNVRFRRAARSERGLFTLLYAWDPAAEIVRLVAGGTGEAGAIILALPKDVQRVYETRRR